MEIALNNCWHEAVTCYLNTLESGHANSDKEQSYCSPDILSSIKGYQLSIRPGEVFRHCTSKERAFKRLALWYNDVEAAGLPSFKTLVRTIQHHYLGILNFFNNRATNAAAESFNAKIKAFRNAMRGVRDVEFFLFGLSKIYA